MFVVRFILFLVFVILFYFILTKFSNAKPKVEIKENKIRDISLKNMDHQKMNFSNDINVDPSVENVNDIYLLMSNESYTKLG